MKAHAAEVSVTSPGRWHRLVWALVFPVRRHRISVTVPGVFLIGLALGIGIAAYNTASNILFITLSLLLACLLLSGLLSWFNMRGVSWRVRTGGPWRAGHETVVAIEVANAKTWLPTYGLWFDLRSHFEKRTPRAEEANARVSELLVAAEREVVRGCVFLRERLAPRGEALVEWVYRPTQRGEAVLELEGVGSLFPFGFLRKSVGTGLRQRVLVWPAQIDYQWKGALAARAVAQGRRTSHAGAGEDLLALRKYSVGDSHRLVHWKASARLGQLMVRQFAAESLEGFALRVDTDAEVWTRAEQFEGLCRFAATLTEDLFAQGRLHGVEINGQWIETRRVRDVEAVLDWLAVVEPVDRTPARMSQMTSPFPGGMEPGETGRFPLHGAGRPVITFAPEGSRGVAAYVEGSVVAAV